MSDTPVVVKLTERGDMGTEPGTLIRIFRDDSSREFRNAGHADGYITTVKQATSGFALTPARARGVNPYSSYYFAGLMKRCADTVDTGV